jgi:hypothetical protein
MAEFDRLAANAVATSVALAAWQSSLSDPSRLILVSSFAAETI